MIKDRLKDLGTRPAFISFILWVFLILLIPSFFSKYRVKNISEEYTDPKNMHFFSDLDSDNQSEEISLDLNDAGQTKIIVSRNDKIFDQYNLKYQSANNNSFFTGDYDHDGFKECYVFTCSQDSIFINIIDPVRLRKILVKNRFVDFRRKVLQSDDQPYIEKVGMIEGLSKNYYDLVFFISTGFSKQPRNVYRYMIAEDSIIKSPESAVVVAGCRIADINNDSLPELLLDVNATGNFDENFPFTDQFSWLMVLNKNLKFIFPPVQFGKYPSRLRVLPLKLKSRWRLILFHDYFGTENIHSAFYLYDSKGNKLNEKPIEEYESLYSSILVNNGKNQETFYFLKNRKGEINEMDSSFHIINSIYIPDIESGIPIAELDANLDGKQEFLFLGKGNKSLVITQDNFRDPVSWEYEKDPEIPYVTQVLKVDSKPMLYLQFKDHGSYIQFYQNPLYYLKYPFYGGLYLAVLFFITVIARIQQYRLNLKLQTEKKMAALQMRAIKNQVDPHFTLNILNAIGSLYATEENRDTADYIFGKYAQLIRQTVISSDQIIITLDEELEFVRNYIDLERFRSNNSFDYSIDVGPDVDLQAKIPRMLIHTFAENAIKYGVRNKSGDGLLKIVLQSKDNIYRIIIEDNGPGLESQSLSVKGTGKGIIILNELIELYYKLERVRITYTLQNISGPENTVAGTIAAIEIQYRNPRS